MLEWNSLIRYMVLNILIPVYRFLVAQSIIIKAHAFYFHTSSFFSWNPLSINMFSSQIHLFSFLYMCICMYVSPLACQGADIRRWCQIISTYRFMSFVNCLIWVLETILGFSTQISNALYSWFISTALIFLFYFLACDYMP